MSIYDKLSDHALKVLERHPFFAGNKYQALSILTEEVGEAARAINDGNDTNLKEELLDVVVVCMRFFAMVEKEDV